MSKLNHWLERAKKSKYLRNVLTLSSGTTVAQLISIGTAPILYRIYSREDYGILGLYMAVVGVVSVFSTMQLSQAVILEREEYRAKSSLLAISCLVCVVSIVVGLLGLLLYLLQPAILNTYGLWPWYFLAPISIFFSGINEVLRVYANRHSEFSLLTRNTMWTAILVPIFSITLGYFVMGPLGLFVGLLIGQTVPPVLMSVYLSRKYSILDGWTLAHRSIKETWARHVKFPKFSLPAELLARFSHQLPVFMLGSFSGVGTVGLYNLANRMLGLPSTLISSAVGEVYKQRAVEEFQRTGSMIRVYKNTFMFLSILGGLVFIIVALFGPLMFSWVFGSEWEAAGQIARVMSLVFFLRFINSPLSYAIYIKEKQYVDLISGIWFVLSSMAVMYYGFSQEWDYLSVIGLFALNFSFMYIIMMLYVYKMSK